MTTIITRIAAGLIVSAGLALGSAAMAPVALAETGSGSSSGASDSRTDRSNKPKQNAHRQQTPEKRGPVGLNGNRPQTGKPDQFRYFPPTLDQFKHLPFNPAMPGGD